MVTSALDHMKWIALTCWLALGLAGCGPEPPLVFADGSARTFQDWAGRWLVINYWAEWCAPCRDEIPELNALHEARPWFVSVVGVNYDGLQGEKLNEAIVRMGIEFPVLVADPKARWGYVDPVVMPMTAIIAPDGQLHRQLMGPQTQQALMAAMSAGPAPKGAPGADEAQAP